MELVVITLLPFLFAPLPLLSIRFGRTVCAYSVGAVAAASLAIMGTMLPDVFAGNTVLYSVPWIPQLGLNFSFRLDGLAALFCILILGIGLLVILYARYYLSTKDPMGRFYLFLLLFMGSMLGVVTSNNLILLATFWELTSISSFLLIGYWSHRPDARQGARQALAVTGMGGLAMLAGFLLLGHIVGSYELNDIFDNHELIINHHLYPVTLVLILLGIFTKSAQFPFHFWLPHAMAAPTPVSAYLHSATMVKAGVFLLARLYPALSGTELWFGIVATVGLATLVFSAYTALFKHDLKGLLAYSTISHLGLITLLFGFNTETAAVAGVFHIINHATFKASLFMSAGIIDHETGTRDIRRLGGIWHKMPYTGALAMLAAAAMAGVPLLNGFLSKEMFFEQAYHLAPAGQWTWLLPVFATLGGIFSVAYSARFVIDVFFGDEAKDLPKTPHEPPRWMRIPVEILVVLCLLVGIAPAFLVGDLLGAASGATLNGDLPNYSLAIWHGFSVPLLMSVIAIVGGMTMFYLKDHLYALHDKLPISISGKAIFEATIAKITKLAIWVTTLIQNGSLQRYLAILVVFAIAFAATPFLAGGQYSIGEVKTPISAPGAMLWLLGMGAAFASAHAHKQRLKSLIYMGVAGLIVSLCFVYFSAPDLALTQISVEIASIILLLLTLKLLPQASPDESKHSHNIRDGVIAVAAGLGVGALAWAAMTYPLDSLSTYYLENSLGQGGGRNVVNVILVDFRGFDTFGEITVLGIAALGLLPLFTAFKRLKSKKPSVFSQWIDDQSPLMLAIATRALLPMALLVSIFIFLAGHNAPGGGFIAGLITSVALVMQYMAGGAKWVEPRLVSDYHPTIGIGLVIAGLTGIGSWFLGYPFLTSAFSHVHVPLLGDFELASAMGFDLGVYLTVVGSVMMILSNLSHMSDESDTEATI